MAAHVSPHCLVTPLNKRTTNKCTPGMPCHSVHALEREMQQVMAAQAHTWHGLQAYMSRPHFEHELATQALRLLLDGIPNLFDSSSDSNCGSGSSGGGGGSGGGGAMQAGPCNTWWDQLRGGVLAPATAEAAKQAADGSVEELLQGGWFAPVVSAKGTVAELCRLLDVAN